MFLIFRGLRYTFCRLILTCLSLFNRKEGEPPESEMICPRSPKGIMEKIRRLSRKDGACYLMTQKIFGKHVRVEKESSLPFLFILVAISM